MFWRLIGSRRAAAPRALPAAIGLVAILALAPVFASAAEIPVPLELQVQLLGKILTFDRSLELAAAGSGAPIATLDVAIVYQQRFRSSLDAMVEALAALDKLPQHRMAGRTLRVTLIDAPTARDLASHLANVSQHVLFVLPLRGIAPSEIANIARMHRIRTFSAVPSYVEAGLAIGIALRGDKPELVVNLEQAKAEGADLHSQLLHLARVIR